jgi:hypothetical protein
MSTIWSVGQELCCASRGQYYRECVKTQFPFVFCLVLVRVISWIVPFTRPKKHDPRNHTNQHETQQRINQDVKFEFSQSLSRGGTDLMTRDPTAIP